MEIVKIKKMGGGAGISFMAALRKLGFNWKPGDYVGISKFNKEIVIKKVVIK